MQYLSQKHANDDQYCTLALYSGVAKVPCALGQKIFLRLPPTEIAEFEMKNRCKSAEEAKAEHLPVCCCCCIFNARNGFRTSYISRRK